MNLIFDKGKIYAMRIFFMSLVFFSLAVLPNLTLAQTGNTGTKNALTEKMKLVAEGAGYAENTDATTLRKIFGSAIGGVLSVLGVMFLIFIIYAGYTYMSAHGEEEKVKKSLATIRQAIIGLIIIISAFALWAFVATYIIK